MTNTGIFWIYKNTLFGVSEKPVASHAMNGLVDSDSNHADAWEQAGIIPAQFPELYNIEYFDIPRGRVLLHLASGKARVYASNHVIHKRKYRQAICRFFSLYAAQVEWWADPHYTLDVSDIDRLFNEF